MPHSEYKIYGLLKLLINNLSPSHTHEIPHSANTLITNNTVFLKNRITVYNSTALKHKIINDQAEDNIYTRN